MRRALAVTGLLALVLPWSVARADLQVGDDKLLHGDYLGAIVAYKAAPKRDAAKAQARLARVLMRTGDYSGAETAAKIASENKADKRAQADGAVALGEIYVLTGRLADARKLFEDVVAKDPAHHRARAQLGLLYTTIGDREKARAIWNQFFDDWDAGKIDLKKADQLLWVAVAARHLEDFHGASDQLQDAVGLDPNLLEANVEWGWMFLEKYDAGNAEQSFDEVLKIDRNHPDAHAGMARVRLEQSYDVKAAMDEIGKALAQNPKHAEALLVRAELEIDNAEYDAALKTLAQIHAVDSTNLHAHALVGTVHWLVDDLPGYERAKRAAFAINPRYAPFTHTVAEFAVKEHRYQEAIALEEEALKIDPRYHLALAGIGINYLRMGDEERGLKALNDANARDRFNVRTYNLLNLFEQTIPREYETLNTASFRLRVAKDEKKILERYLPRFLERAHADMVKRYGFTPKKPIGIELFNDPEQYSVRTVGLPNLSALAVCFGQVVTAMSPSNGNISWSMVLWHELGHVFAIQLSSSRVPRWYTEGLSEYETILARPEWRRENDVDVWQALVDKELPSVVDLNSRFLRARDLEDMVVAYHMSSLAVEFIGQRWGFPKLVEGLKLFGKGRLTRDVIPAITGLSIERFDAEFKRHLEQKLAVYKGSFRVSLGRYGDLTALEKAAAAKPTDADAQAGLALGYFVAEDGDRARASAQKALAIDGKNRKALWALAQVAAAAGDSAEAKRRLAELIAAGGDGYDVRLVLAKQAIGEKDVAAAERELTRAKQLDPQRSEPSFLLYDIFTKSNREADALRELERFAQIENMDYGAHKRLVEKYAARGNVAKAREYGEKALDINPLDAELHVMLGEVYLAAPAMPDKAIFELESAAILEESLRRPAVVYIALAKAHVAKRDTAKAKKALAKALEHEPENAEALALRKTLGK
jgi:tetratricopeptide (TPR) repeat protein